MKEDGGHIKVGMHFWRSLTISLILSDVSILICAISLDSSIVKSQKKI